ENAAEAAQISRVSYAGPDRLRPFVGEAAETGVLAPAEPVPAPGVTPLAVERRDQWDAGLTLAALEDLAVRNNPSIQQANSTAAKAAGIQTQVGLRPNPSIGYFGEEIGNEGAGGLNGAYVQQTLVTGDKLAWNQAVVGHDVNALMWQVEAQRQRVRTDIRVQFYLGLVAQQRLRLAREFREVAEKGVQVSEDRLQIQVGARPDLLQSQMQLNEVDLMIQRAELDLEAAWNQLAATAGVPHMVRPHLAGELEVPAIERDVEAVYQQIISVSPVLASARARVDRARANLQRQ